MRSTRRGLLAALIAVSILAIAIVVVWFDRDMQSARAHATQGSVLVETPCGPIEFQEAGSGVPLLAVHGSGGGFDQGMALAGSLATRGIRVIAMSRFGYLRTPMSVDVAVDVAADVAADVAVNTLAATQAAAHVCLLDALGIPRAAVMGYSAGGPSALQMAIRHPDRVSALILTVPIAYRPHRQAASTPTMPPWFDRLVMRVSGSDFLAWAALRVARTQAIKWVLATPPELLKNASMPEQARVNAMLTHILPVSARTQGLRSDTTMGKHLGPLPLALVRAPTLIFSARDDGYGTYPGAQYTASQISNAKFVGFEEGGHALVGHYDQVMDQVGALVMRTGAR